jgi:cell division protein FtsZ
LINLDFADVRSVMHEMGKAMMGTGEAEGDGRALEAAEKAIANPLLDGVSMQGAKGVIVSITGGEDMRLMEVDEAANHIRELVDPDANIIWGSAFNEALNGKIRVSVVATGIDNEGQVSTPSPRSFPFERATPTPAPASNMFTPAPIETAVESIVEQADEVEGAAEELVALEPSGDEELLELGGTEEVADEAPAPVPAPASDDSGTREFGRAAPKIAAGGGGTLFERMSNLSRGLSRAEEEPSDPDDDDNAPSGLNIPRFLDRQGNN